MYLGLDFLGSEDFLYDAILIDKISSAKYSDGFSTAGHLLAPASQLLQQSGSPTDIISSSGIATTIRPDM